MKLDTVSDLKIALRIKRIKLIIKILTNNCIFRLIKYMTEGVLLRELLNTADLDKYSKYSFEN